MFRRGGCNIPKMLGLLFLDIELVKKLFHVTHFLIGERVGRNEIRNIQRGNFDYLLPGILPSDVCLLYTSRCV